jgi:aspartyl-tRNA(Asn)/glutamyl-tRNA(Gln) amidotransferase subunit B
VKNINSFRFAKQAIDYEVKRQIELLEKGQMPIQETRGFDEKRQVTYSQRTKEEAADYRYFPEPDIPPLTFSKKYIDGIKVLELPQQKLERYVNRLGIRWQDAFLLTRDKDLADFFEKVISNFQFPISKQISNFKQQISNIEQRVANLIVNKKISTNLSEHDFIEKIIHVFKPKKVDEEKLNQLINQLIKINKKAVEDYKKGKQNAIMFLVGQVMRELKGQVEAKIVIDRLKEKLT